MEKLDYFHVLLSIKPKWNKTKIYYGETKKKRITLTRDYDYLNLAPNSLPDRGDNSEKYLEVSLKRSKRGGKQTLKTTPQHNKIMYKKCGFQVSYGWVFLFAYRKYGWLFWLLYVNC